MKSPAQLANLLARQWLRADWREQQLLSLHDKAWPLRLRLGEPDPSQFRDDSARVQAHVLHWRGVSEHGPGAVLWRERQYRDGASPVSLPVQWTLCTPSDLVRAIAEHGAPEHKFIVGLHQALGTILQQVNACFRSVLVRKLALWRHLPPDEVVRACAIAMQLAPGCARGKPLRALQLSGSDTKFFERNERLLTVLADERFDGEVSQQGLVNFLGADPEGEHWLLVVPLTAGLLPFARLRLTTDELRQQPLPGSHVLLVENERCLHQLPRQLPGTVAILGAGRNLGWLDATWLQHRRVAYWGDLDTWGLLMLAVARHHLPGLTPLLMSQATWLAHRHLAVREPTLADCAELATDPELAPLVAQLRTSERGRLEQEFLPTAAVTQAIMDWHASVPLLRP